MTQELKLAQKQNLSSPGKLIIVYKHESIFDHDVMIVADSSNNRLVVVRMDTMEYLMTIGDSNEGDQDGNDFDKVQFYHPQGLCHYRDNDGESILLVCDVKNHLIRKVNLSQKTVEKVVGIRGLRGSDRRGGATSATNQEIASPWDICPVLNDSGDSPSQFIVAMAGTH